MQDWNDGTGLLPGEEDDSALLPLYLRPQEPAPEARVYGTLAEISMKYFGYDITAE